MVVLMAVEPMAHVGSFTVGGRAPVSKDGKARHATLPWKPAVAVAWTKMQVIQLFSCVILISSVHCLRAGAFNRKRQRKHYKRENANVSK